MNFSEPGLPLMPAMLHYVGGGVGGDASGYWSQFELKSEEFDVNSEFDQPLAPPSKRPRNFEDNRSGSVASNPRPNPPVNKGTTNIFWKTRMCAKFKIGMCRNGENCNFAHGVEDMRQPPPNWQELVGVRDEDNKSSGNWEDDQKIIHRMKLCKKFYNGEECPYGDRCNFLHEDPAKFRDDSGRFRETSAICIGTTGMPTGQGTGSSQSDVSRPNTGADSRVTSKPVYWKTKLCTKWEITGQCPFGEKCHFAHGLADLQSPSGRFEGDAVQTALVVATKPQPQLLHINDGPPLMAAKGPTSTEEAQSKKCLLRWKGHKKINQIYGDWLDDLPLVQNLPNKVES